jgi:hypothetical protein
MATGVSEAVEVAKPTLVDAVDIFQGILSRRCRFSGTL